jgi:hypothetical protein
MGRALLVLNSAAERARATQWIAKAPPGTRVEFKASKRSLDQNAKMWASLTDIATQVVWYGAKLSAEDWKDVMTASLRKARVVPGLDPGTYVPIGMRTSDMSKDEMSALIELVLHFGAEHGVAFHDQPDERSAA